MSAGQEEVGLTEFVDDVSGHLRASWDKDSALVVTVDEGDADPPVVEGGQISVDTVEDLEAIHYAMQAVRDEPAADDPSTVEDDT